MKYFLIGFLLIFAGCDEHENVSRSSKSSRELAKAAWMNGYFKGVLTERQSRSHEEVLLKFYKDSVEFSKFIDR